MSSPGKYKLVITDGPSKGKEFVLEGKTAGLGRDPKNQIVLDNQSVSLFHVRVTTEKNGCSVTNLGSIEGVKVNGKNVDSTSLSPGDRLQVGNVKLRLESGVRTKKPAAAKNKRYERKQKKRRGPALPLKPSVIILSLLALFAALILLNIRWFSVITNW